MKYLPDLCSAASKLGAFGLTEPERRLPMPPGQQTMAVLDGSGANYILNGTKCFITNGTDGRHLRRSSP